MKQDNQLLNKLVVAVKHLWQVARNVQLQAAIKRLADVIATV